jgi:hypothetical protein
VLERGEEGIRLDPKTRKQIETALQAAITDPAAIGKLVIALHATREQIRAAHEASKAKLVAC